MDSKPHLLTKPTQQGATPTNHTHFNEVQPRNNAALSCHSHSDSLASTFTMYKLVEWTLNFINRAYVNLVYFYYLEGGTRPLLLGVYRQGDSCINSMQPSEKLDTNADSVGTLDMTPHTQRRQPGKRNVPISPAQAIIALHELSHIQHDNFHMDVASKPSLAWLGWASSPVMTMQNV